MQRGGGIEETPRDSAGCPVCSKYDCTLIQLADINTKLLVLKIWK